MKKTVNWIIGAILAAVFTLCLVSCPNVRENPDAPDNDARLALLAIAGKEVALGTPAANLETAAASEIQLSFEESSDAEIEITTQSSAAQAMYGRMAGDGDTPVLQSSGTVSFSDGDLLAVRVRAGNGAQLYYKVAVQVAPPDGTTPPDPNAPQSALLGRVLILQAYGTGNNTDGGVSHSFIELYNESDEPADLSGHFLQYSTGGESWHALNLDGKTIPPRSSFLVLGRKQNVRTESQGGAQVTGRLQLDEADADMLWYDGGELLQMNNNRYKIFLVQSNRPVMVINPFDYYGDKTGVKTNGYIDLLGTNDTDLGHNIDAFETAYLQDPDIKAAYLASKGKSVRRVDLTDTDDNASDFEQVEWRIRLSPNDVENISEEDAEKLRPRSSADGDWDPVYIGRLSGNSNTNISNLVIGGQSADSGAPAESYSAVTEPGSVTISELVASSAAIAFITAPDAVFRTAQVSGGGEPEWNDSVSPVYSFANGDFLYIEVTAADGKTTRVYKIIVTVASASDTVTVSGSYTLNLNSSYAQQRVAIEAYDSQAAVNLISRTEADRSNKTWSMSAPNGEALWFRVAVTDETGYTFGKVVSTSGQTFVNDTSNVALTLGGFAAPQMTAFTLIDASGTSSGGGGWPFPTPTVFTRENKTGAINQTSGAITFASTSFSTVSVNATLNFHALKANFTLSADSKLYADGVEQISGVTANNYYQPVTFTVVAEDNARKTYTVAGRANNYSPIAGTTSFQTQGFGVMRITTTDKTTGLPTGTSAGKLNNIWNSTGQYTYIGPEGRVLSGTTDVRARGNHSFRADTRKSYAMKLPSSARVGFDYYNFKTGQFEILPAHRRWVLLAHETDTSKIRTTTGYEMGRHVLTKMGWQPHGDFVFFFLNDDFKGVYILSEDIRIDAGRLDIIPEASTDARTGGWAAQINNFWWYAQDIQSNSNSFIFDELYNFMTSHQNPTADQNSTIRQQGVVFSLAVPDENLGWYEPDPPGSTGSLAYTNTTHMPRKGFALMATLGDGSGYNRASSPLSEWRVPDDFGRTNGMGTRNMLLPGNFGQNNGGFYGTRTIGPLFEAVNRTPQSSVFVQMAEIIQNAEDAIYGHQWGNSGVGGYHDYIDIDSFIDWQIATEMTSNFELSVLNGQYMHYDPGIGKLKMGPIWDLDKAWGETSTGGGWWQPPGWGSSSQAAAGFVRKSPFWYKELLGWEITGTGSDIFNHPGRDNSDRKDPYYTQRLKARWNEVRGEFIDKLGPYIDAQNTRLSRIATYSSVNYQQTVQPSTALKTTITNRVNALNTVINGY